MNTVQPVIDGLPLSAPSHWALFALVTVLGCAFFFSWRQRGRRPAGANTDFFHRPDLFDRRVVELEGTIVRVLSNSFAEIVRRKFRNWVYSRLKIRSSRGRFVHQRFLLSLPEGRRGDTILVEHNIRFGRLRLRRHSTVRVRGEYIHRSATRFRFGKIHKTHAPIGAIRIVTASGRDAGRPNEK